VVEKIKEKEELVASQYQQELRRKSEVRASSRRRAGA
jgi:hypothetical protein